MHSHQLHQSGSAPANTNVGKQQEHKHSTNALILNRYLRKSQQVDKKHVLRQDKIPSPEKLVKMFFENVKPKKQDYAVLSYIKGLTETQMTSEATQQPNHYKTPCTLQQMFPLVNDTVPHEQQTNVVCKTNCWDCSKSCIGEIGRSFVTRKKRQSKVYK